MHSSYIVSLAIVGSMVPSGASPRARTTPCGPAWADSARPGAAPSRPYIRTVPTHGTPWGVLADDSTTSQTPDQHGAAAVTLDGAARRNDAHALRDLPAMSAESSCTLSVQPDPLGVRVEYACRSYEQSVAPPACPAMLVATTARPSDLILRPSLVPLTSFGVAWVTTRERKRRDAAFPPRKPGVPSHTR